MKIILRLSNCILVREREREREREAKIKFWISSYSCKILTMKTWQDIKWNLLQVNVMLSRWPKGFLVFYSLSLSLSLWVSQRACEVLFPLGMCMIQFTNQHQWCDYLRRWERKSKREREREQNAACRECNREEGETLLGCFFRQKSKVKRSKSRLPLLAIWVFLSLSSTTQGAGWGGGRSPKRNRSNNPGLLLMWQARREKERGREREVKRE